jgi:hypothetical protein
MILAVATDGLRKLEPSEVTLGGRDVTQLVYSGTEGVDAYAWTETKRARPSAPA